MRRSTTTPPRRSSAFKGGTIEGPTHFSQFAPLGARLWGQAWFETGCLSAHYRNACFEGEEVQAILSKPLPGTSQCQIQMVKRDGTEVLRGTASVGDRTRATALETRLTELKPLADPVILRDVKVAQTSKRQTVRMAFDQNMGDLYPFSLRQKLKVITEPLAVLFRRRQSLGPGDHPDGDAERAVSVPLQGRSAAGQGAGGRPVRRPGDPADPGAALRRRGVRVEREVVALSGSRRTESAWIKTRVFDKAGAVVATMLLNMATLKDSYAPYEMEYRRLYGTGR